jgi:hypothetical protein
VAVLVERVTASGAGRGWTGEYLEAEVWRPELRVNEVVECRVAGVKRDKLLTE